MRRTGYVPGPGEPPLKLGVRLVSGIPINIGAKVGPFLVATLHVQDVKNFFGCEIPPSDSGHEFVTVVFPSCPCPSTGYSFEWDAEKGRLSLKVPGKNCLCGCAFTLPYAVFDRAVDVKEIVTEMETLR